jgi:hypothetical protein
MLKGEEQNTFLLCNVQGCLLQKPGACSPGKQYCTLVESATVDSHPGERVVGVVLKDHYPSNRLDHTIHSPCCLIQLVRRDVGMAQIAKTGSSE